MKWLFYVIVFVYMFYRAVYGARGVELTVDPIKYGEKGFLSVGEHKAINCKASAKNQKLEWINPSGSTIKRIPGNRVFVQEHFVPSPSRARTPALVLTITRAEVRDSGVYQCRSGDQAREVSLCVIEPSEFIDTPVEVTSDVGRSITLSCQAKGDPEPRILWSRDSVTITDEDSSEKYKVMTKYNSEGFEGLLTITSLTPEDSGVYSCISIQENTIVDNCTHEQTLNITLNVNHAPKFEHTDDQNVYARNNEQVQIPCSAPGYPLPEYRWFRELANDSLFEYDKKQIKVIEEENKALLTVVANSATFDKRFKCEATNNQGTAEKYFVLMRIEKPRKIDEVSVYETTDKSIDLNVTWYNISFPVNSFKIQYIADDRKNRKKYSKESGWRRSQSQEFKLDEEDEVLPDIGTIVTLSDLERDTTYWIRLRAVNDAGESPWCDPIVETTSAEAPTTTEASDEAETENGDEEHNGEAEKETDEANINDGTFYGIFFAGGIFVVSFVCMMAMRMVK